jgi:cell division protein FtsB
VNVRLKKMLRIPLIALCLLGPILAWLAFGEQGFIRLYRMEMERQSYVERIQRLSEENQAMIEEINRLRTDMRYVEAVARKDLGLVKKNELIYRFSGKDNGQADPGGRSRAPGKGYPGDDSQTGRERHDGIR